MGKQVPRAYWYESIPIELLDPFDVPEERTGGIKTGGMKGEEWESLVSSIKEEGLANPIMVEDDNTSLKIPIGNNRVWAMKQLGETHIKAVVFTRSKADHQMPPGGVRIPNNFFVYQMKKLHPGDETWKKCISAQRVASSAYQIEGELTFNNV